MDRKRRLIVASIFAAAQTRLAAAIAAPRSREELRAQPRLGINLAGIVWYNTERPFVDQFRMAGDWSLKSLATNGPAPFPLRLDAEGWVREVPPGTWVETPVFGECRLPLGEWTVLYEGKGRIEVWGTLTDARYGDGRASFKVVPHDKGLVWLRLWGTDPANPVRNIRVLTPGHEKTYATEPWSPSFLARWRGMAALRFMDFMETTNSKVVRWSDRSRPEHATFDRRGVPVEWLIDLANRLGAEPWFCMPHLADDDYVRRFAARARERLDPRLRAHVEYSNEIWNTRHGQHQYCRQRGLALRLSQNDFEAALRYAALRSVEMFRIWEAEFGGSHRLVRVLSSQAFNPWSARTMLAFQDAAAHADALAVGAYLTFVPTPQSRPGDAEIGRWTLDQLFSALEGELGRLQAALRENSAVAAQYGVRLVAYEGGQHLVGALGAENNDALTALFQAANRDPRMGLLYQRLYALWQAVGGDLFCHFSSVSPSGKWGSWGLLEHHDDPPADSPKLVASLGWAAARGQKVARLR
jgi:hypothetical protein